MFRVKTKDSSDSKAKKPEDKKPADKKPTAKAPAAPPSDDSGDDEAAPAPDAPADPDLGAPATDVAPAPAAPPMLPMTGGAGMGDKLQVNPAVAGYMPPEEGPFMCSRCTHFTGQNACEIVSGEIAPDGCCNLFESNFNEAQPDMAMGMEGMSDDGQMAGATPPTGPPTEEGY